MKYIKFLFLALFVSLALVSCGDDSNPTDKEVPGQYRPTSVTVYDSLTHQKQGGRLFSYNGKLLTSVDYLDEKDEIIGSIKFEYYGENLIKQTATDDDGVLELEYYADGKLESKTSMYEEGKYGNKYKFIYDGGKISKVETYSYYNGVWNTDPVSLYEYFYNDKEQLLRRTSKYREDVDDEWEIDVDITLLYTNDRVSKYRTEYKGVYEDDEYVNYFIAYDSDSRPTKFSIESDEYPRFVGLSFIYDNSNLKTLFFKNDYDGATVKMDINWEKQESNIFEVSKLLIIEEPVSTISDYFNLLMVFIND